MRAKRTGALGAYAHGARLVASTKINYAAVAVVDWKQLTSSSYTSAPTDLQWDYRALD